ncbi:MAG TPA: COX15/CtaA family protein [Afifellaceae bacterium]|nr:COX15/CtaA family protein [Afifellaceae bacterium]
MRAVRAWLAATALLVLLIVLVGGATRLTDSGLSITEWKPVVGALPPFSQADWQAEFTLYRQTPQYELLNEGMSLAEFKFIYWWEWGHRQLGRLIGLVFLGGLVWFAMRRVVNLRQGLVLFAAGLLLGTQGLIGWIMVASGLEPGMTAVAPVKLTLHLTLACLFFAALIVLIARLGREDGDSASSGKRIGAWVMTVAIFVQIALGGLVAGHDAGLTYNTWPLMDGDFIPDGLAALSPYGMNFIDNITAIQFNHRIGAYILTLLIVMHTLAVWRTAVPAVRQRLAGLTGLVAVQMVLGIVTLLYVVPFSAALAHQGVALVMLAVAVWHAARLRPTGPAA